MTRLRLPSVLVAATASALIALAPSSAPGHSCVRGDELWFRAVDGTRLVGHRFGGKTPGRRTAVVLAHMSEGDLCSWLPYVRSLAARGLFAFPFDFRGYGFSEGVRDHRRAPADVTAAVRTVRRLGAKRIVVVGASLGGIAALVAAASIRPAPMGVAAVSAPAAIPGELDARRAVRRLAAPVLYVAAEGDQNADYDFAADARMLHALTATGERRLELVPGTLHGTFLVDGSAEVRRLLRAFVRAPGATVP